MARDGYSWFLYRFIIAHFSLTHYSKVCFHFSYFLWTSVINYENLTSCTKLNTHQNDTFRVTLDGGTDKEWRLGTESNFTELTVEKII